MSKKKISKRKVLIKNRQIIAGIGVIILLTSMFLLFIPKNNKKTENNNIEKIELGEFEKIAIYKMIEETYLKDGLLYIINENSENMDRYSKYLYTAEKILANSNTTNIDKIIREYEKIFGEQTEEEKINSIAQNLNETSIISYIEDGGIIEITKEQEDEEKEEDINETQNEQYYYLIKDIFKDNELYIVELEVRKVNEQKVENYILDNDFIEEGSNEESEKLLGEIQQNKNNYAKLQTLYNEIINEENQEQLTTQYGKGELCLKIEENRLIIDNYREIKD